MNAHGSIRFAAALAGVGVFVALFLAIDGAAGMLIGILGTGVT